MSAEVVSTALRKLTSGESMTRAEAARVMQALMDGKATPAQIGALLTALRMKGETVEEVTGLTMEMRARSVVVPAQRHPLVDTCGTGGSRYRVFNVSTASAFVAAAAGVSIAKHGNRAVTGVCGSADVLEALGVRIDLSPDRCAACIDELGIGFIFAPAHHPALKYVGGPRREIGIRTIFNLLGPLANPADASRQVMGVYDRSLGPLAVAVLRELGSERAIVAHGEIGIGEISIIGRTYISELKDGKITHYTLTPADLGIEERAISHEDLAPAASPVQNAELLRSILAGETSSESDCKTVDSSQETLATNRAIAARRDLVIVNAAAALRVSGLANEWLEAVRIARSVLASGQALTLLESLINFTNKEITGKEIANEHPL